MKVSDLKGLPVINMAGGTKVGAVQDALVDTTGLRVAALLISGDGGEALLPFAAIRAIGADAVTVADADATQGTTGRAPAEGWHSLSDLRDLRVVDGAGTYLGAVQEVDFDPTDGRVGELVARRGGMLGRGGAEVRVPAGAIRGMGPKLVTVDLAAPAT